MRVQASICHSPFELAAAFHDESDFVFLDSASRDRERGRRSVLAWKAKSVLRTRGEDPFSMLEAPANRIGYLSYDLFRYLENYDITRKSGDLDLPECWLAHYDVLMIFDHASNEWTLDGQTEDCIRRRLIDIENRLIRQNGARQPETIGRLDSNMTRAQYVGVVEKVLDYIAAGEIYQANIAQRFATPFNADPFELFATLRELSPAFYSAYLNCGDHVVISSSPELFLSKRGDAIETRPIKGTRPRGRTPEEDRKFQDELLASEKEKAELAMIVDLERNDLGRICEYGSVTVVDNRHVDPLPTVFHTAATIKGKLRPGLSTADILRATFPGGSISGCPKIRAIEIIDELEPSGRHVYTGAIGWMCADGDLTLSIAIRTMVVAAGHVYFHVGSGIVADSDPSQEYEETLVKATAMERAIARVLTGASELQVRPAQH